MRTNVVVTRTQMAELLARFEALESQYAPGKRQIKFQKLLDFVAESSEDALTLLMGFVKGGEQE